MLGIDPASDPYTIEANWLLYHAILLYLEVTALTNRCRHAKLQASGGGLFQPKQFGMDMNGLCFKTKSPGFAVGKFAKAPNARSTYTDLSNFAYSTDKWCLK